MVEAVTTQAEAKRQIVLAAKAIVSEEQDVLEACRAIVEARAGLDDDLASDPDVLVFVGIESELDDVPGPAERIHWEKNALAEADRQKDSYLETVMPELLRASRALIERWSS